MRNVLFLILISLSFACKKKEAKASGTCSGSFTSKEGSKFISTKDSSKALEKEFYLSLMDDNRESAYGSSIFSSASHLDFLKAQNIWTTSQGEGIIVAVIDTGIDLAHPELKNNLWVNKNEIPGNGIDDDNDGFVDDVNGYNFAYNNGNISDDHGHGTHVSGIIAGSQTGIAPKAKLMVIKAIDATGSGLNTDLINGINFAVSHGANIINASWGSYIYSDALRAAIAEAESNGVVFVAAAGNDGADNDLGGTYPATYNLSNVVAVAASTISGNSSNIANYSNFGVRTVPAIMPGTGILSTWINESKNYLSGTSMATPMMTGTIALIASFEKSLGYKHWIARALCTNNKEGENFSTSFGCHNKLDNINSELTQNTPVLVPAYARTDDSSLNLQIPTGFSAFVISGSATINGSTLEMNSSNVKVGLKNSSGQIVSQGNYFYGDSEPALYRSCDGS